MFALREGIISCLVSSKIKWTGSTSSNYQPELNGITEDSGENCKASSTVRSLVWLKLAPFACRSPLVGKG